MAEKTAFLPKTLAKALPKSIFILKKSMAEKTDYGGKDRYGGKYRLSRVAKKTVAEKTMAEKTSAQKNAGGGNFREILPWPTLDF